MRGRLKVIRDEWKNDKSKYEKKVHGQKDGGEKKQTTLTQWTEPHRILSWWSAGGEWLLQCVEVAKQGQDTYIRKLNLPVGANVVLTPGLLTSS